MSYPTIKQPSSSLSSQPAVVNSSTPIFTDSKIPVATPPTTTEKPSIGNRFALPDSEGIEYKGTLMLSAPSRSCKDEIMANEAIISKRVPFLVAIVEDGERIRKKTIMKRQAAIQLVSTTNYLFTTFFSDKYL